MNAKLAAAFLALALIADNVLAVMHHRHVHGTGIAFAVAMVLSCAGAGNLIACVGRKRG